MLSCEKDMQSFLVEYKMLIDGDIAGMGDVSFPPSSDGVCTCYLDIAGNRAVKWGDRGIRILNESICKVSCIAEWIRISIVQTGQ